MNRLTCLALLALVAGNLPSARAAESYDGCAGFITSLPATISTQGVWCMNKDLATSLAAGPAITISTNNVTLDCNSFKLGGLAAGAGTSALGVFAVGRSNLTIRNCNIRGFRYGIYLDDAIGSGHLVEDNLLEGNTQIGMRVFGSSSLVRRNRVVETGGTTSPANFLSGIHVAGVVDVEDNLVSGIAGDLAQTHFIYGILSENRGRIARNKVRDLAPTFPGGQGVAMGIAVISLDFALVEGNEVDRAVDTMLSRPIYCADPSGTRVRDNLMVSYPNSLSDSCINLGNNLYVP